MDESKADFSGVTIVANTRRLLNIAQLEDRATPAVFVVTTTTDNGDNTTPLPGSFRAAIVAANSTAGIDTINFSIPGTGVQTLSIAAALPNITEGVTINGNSQPGFANSPLIRLNGAGLPSGTNGLTLSNQTSSTIKSLVIGGFSSGAGIRIDGGGLNIISNNFIGTDATGNSADANAVGVVVTNSKGNFIGNSTETKNIISGNTSGGILITDGSSLATISGNYLGIGTDGIKQLGNGSYGVALTNGAVSNIIGGSVAGSGNIVASNKGPGILIDGPTTAGNTISGNRIGLDFGGFVSANQGDGIRVSNKVATQSSAGIPFQFPDLITTIRQNTISQNKGNGIAVASGSQHVRIVDNNINANAGVGISVEPNSNDNLAPPVLSKLVNNSSGVTITGTIAGRAGTKYEVNVYGLSVADPSGFGEGENRLATINVTTDASGAGRFTTTVPTLQSTPFFSATVSHASTGDTSGFSLSQARPGVVDSSRFPAAAAGQGAAPQVSLYNSTGTISKSYTAFDSSFTGGVRLAVADFNGDTVPDIVVGTGPGAPTLVRVIDGQTSNEIFRRQPFEASFTGGIYVAVGDITGDGTPELVVSPDEGGGPRVTVMNGTDFSVLADFFGIDDKSFRGGARTAVGDITGDGKGDLIVAAGFGGGPRVSLYGGLSVASGRPTQLVGDFFIFEETLRNGAFIALGDLNKDGFAEIIAGGGPGGGPRVFALSGQAILNGTQQPVANFFAGDPSNRGGIRVASRDLNIDGTFELLTGDGNGAGGKMRVYTGSDLTPNGNPTPVFEVAAFPDAPGGIFVG